jgi:hypothetical protein
VRVIKWETSGVSVTSTFDKNHELVYGNGVVLSPFSLLPSAFYCLDVTSRSRTEASSYHKRDSGCWILDRPLRGSWTYYSVDFGPNIPCTMHGSWTCHCEDLGPIIAWTLDVYHGSWTCHCEDLGRVIARILDLL